MPVKIEMPVTQFKNVDLTIYLVIMRYSRQSFFPHFLFVSVFNNTEINI